MARIKPPCKIEGCTGFGMSLGNRGGKPYYSNVCKKHRQNARNRKVRHTHQARLKAKKILQETLGEK